MDTLAKTSPLTPAPTPADAGLGPVLAASAPVGHFDELRGHTRIEPSEPPSPLTPSWEEFFRLLGPQGLNDLQRRRDSLARQLRDNGVTYNVYADASGPQRPWALDLFPLILTPESWQQIETGVLQRVRVLDHVLADLYGPRQLLASGLLPAALVQGHPGYLRAMHGVPAVGGMHLHIAAFDLARGPDGNWWVMAQRTQAPSGLGYLLENRMAVSRQFPQAFEAMQVQRLASTYRAFIEGLKAMSPAGEDSHMVLLTSGPYNETYFEHAYLARYLGLTLVEGSDLVVRDQRLYLKTLKGLQPVHVLLKRLDDEFLDPLELRPDSTLGVPGLLQVIRAGHVLVANAPGSAFVESPALLGFLPALARHLLHEELTLPALPTWWCGEQSVLADALPMMADAVIHPTYPASGGRMSFEPVSGPALTPAEQQQWAERIRREPDEHTLQANVPLSQMPVWRPSAQSCAPGPQADEPLSTGSVVLRVFAVADGPRSWRILPGGMARLPGQGTPIASMQRGGSSADVWVQAPGRVDPTTLLPAPSPSSFHLRRQRQVTSRAAENLFWLGRYTERAENTVRLARLSLVSLNGDDQSSQPLLAWVSALAVRNGLVLPDVPSAAQARRVFERALIDSLDQSHIASVGYNLRALRQAASAVRERLSQEHWNVILQAESEFTTRCGQLHRDEAGGGLPTVDALLALEGTSGFLAAITGAQTDRMTRDNGWRLLSIGRHIERLGFLSHALLTGLQLGALSDEAGFEATVALFDSTITFHAQYQQSRVLAALLDLLVLDRDNPRSLAWVIHSLRTRLTKLAELPAGHTCPLAQCLPDPDAWSIESLCALGEAQQPSALAALLQHCVQAAYDTSEQVSARYFTHSGNPQHTLVS